MRDLAVEQQRRHARDKGQDGHCFIQWLQLVIFLIQLVLAEIEVFFDSLV